MYFPFKRPLIYILSTSLGSKFIPLDAMVSLHLKPIKFTNVCYRNGINTLVIL